MSEAVVQHLRRLAVLQRFNLSMSRAAATGALRQLDPTNPLSWEFSGFSQNGEDGIIDYLTRRMHKPNRYFIEIGAADGMENNTSWLAIGRRFCGLMIDGNPQAANLCRQAVCTLNGGVVAVCAKVKPDNVGQVLQSAQLRDPDVFSLDIDGVDYFIAERILEMGFRPKVWVVEYNSAFGPEQSLTVHCTDDFSARTAHSSQLYYGVSITGWKRWFQRNGYQFITVDGNGVNAFFLDPDAFDSEFREGLNGLAFQENFWQLRRFGHPWPNQFERIRDMPFFPIE